jgi:hypothetical protein
MSDTVQTLSRFTASVPIATLSRTETEYAQAFAGIAARLDQAA